MLVPVCLSVSHVAFCSARVESTFMQLGNSAGIAAALAVEQNKSVQDLNIKDLQKKLTQRSVIYNINYQIWNSDKDINGKYP